jgi:hypothetical protein
MNKTLNSFSKLIAFLKSEMFLKVNVGAIANIKKGALGFSVTIISRSKPQIIKHDGHYIINLDNL